jgi:ABC-type antimicrobial peptide transport system permease subunit
MFYHFKIILRNLRRNFTYSAINIAGLTIGITVSVLIFLWVHHERSFDRYYPDADRIYSVLNSLKFGTGDPWIFSSSPYPLVLAMGNDIPEVESIAMMYTNMIDGVKVGDEVFSVKSAVRVNKTWFEMFDYKLVDGSFDAFGNHPFSVVLTETEAAKYFGKSKAVGQTISLDNADYTVQAVVKDNPSNSSFQYGLMASVDAVLKEDMLQDWGNFNLITFVKFRSGVDVTQVCEKINDILHGNKFDMATVFMRPLTDIHFETDQANFYIVHGNKRMVSIFGLLGILLVCMASINYVNLATARANVRSKEIGMKKIVGARRSALFAQLVAESFIYCLIAVALSLLFIAMLLPRYQTFAGNVEFSFASPVLWTIMGIVLLVTTALNSIYPAMMLSSFRPLNFMQGIGLLKVKNSNLRRGLVVFQFTLSVTLIVCVIVIFLQMRYVQDMDTGYNCKQIFTVVMPKSPALQNIRNELQSNPAIAGIAISNQTITYIGNKYSGDNDWEGRDKNFVPELRNMAVDANYGQLLGLKLADGRWFSAGNATDEINVILNQTAIRELNIHEPYIGQRFDFMSMKGNIIGIVEDFHFQSLHEKITPLVLYHSLSLGSHYFHVNIKTHPGKQAEAVQAAKLVWKQFFPNEPFNYFFLEDSLNGLYQSDIRTSQLMLVFSILAVVIAALGLFGLSTFAIERRTKEVGIRKVLGASMLGVVRLLTREFLVLVAIAFAIAAPLSWWVMSRWLQNFAYRIPITVWIFVAGAAATLVIALAAVGIQAVKAATANPVKAIKSE